MCCVLSHVSHVRPFATLWNVACQVPLSMGSSRQEYWSRLPCPPPRDLQGWNGTQRWNLCLSCLLHWHAGSLPPHHLGSPKYASRGCHLHSSGSWQGQRSPYQEGNKITVWWQSTSQFTRRTKHLLNLRSWVFVLWGLFWSWLPIKKNKFCFLCPGYF